MLHGLRWQHWRNSHLRAISDNFPLARFAILRGYVRTICLQKPPRHLTDWSRREALLGTPLGRRQGRLWPTASRQRAKVVVMGFEIVEIDEAARAQVLVIEESHIADLKARAT